MSGLVVLLNLLAVIMAGNVIPIPALQIWLWLPCFQQLLTITSGCVKTAQIAEPSIAQTCSRSDYTDFQDSCYKCYVNPTCGVQTYLGAVAQCNADGANLASVHSNNLVTPLTSQCTCSPCDSTWIGLLPDPVNGFPSGYYEDGTPYDYANWNTGQPVSGDPLLRTFVSRVPGFERQWETDSIDSVAQNFWCCELAIGLLSALKGCTTAGAMLMPFGNTFVRVSAGPGQTAMSLCTAVTGPPIDQYVEGVNPANKLPGNTCNPPCTSSLLLTCDGTTGQFTFIPTSGPDTGTPVVAVTFLC